MRIWSLKQGGASACKVDCQSSWQTEAHLSHHLCFSGFFDIALNFGILSSPHASIFFFPYVRLMILKGADIDFGAQLTRPMASRISPEEELDNLPLSGIPF